jgi:hypothetical protein
MKYNIKVFLAIAALIIIIPLDGILLLKTINNQSQNDTKTQKQNQEIEKSILLNNDALKIINSRLPLSIDIKDKPLQNNLPASNSANLTTNGKYKLQILNATNISGKANNLNEKLKLTEVFSDITIDNASSTVSSVVKSKKVIPVKTYQELISLLKTDLPNFQEETLPDTDSYDIIIVIGTEK